MLGKAGLNAPAALHTPDRMRLQQKVDARGQGLPPGQIEARLVQPRPVAPAPAQLGVHKPVEHTLIQAASRQEPEV